MKKPSPRIVTANDHEQILYIKHLGDQPYNEVKYECGKKIVVCHSINYWHAVFNDFYRIRKGLLINPNKIISQNGLSEIILCDDSRFTYSRRKAPFTLKKLKKKGQQGFEPSSTREKLNSIVKN